MSSNPTDTIWFSLDQAKLLSQCDSLEFGFVRPEETVVLTKAVEYFDSIIVQLVAEIEQERSSVENVALLELPTSDRSFTESSLKWQIYLNGVKKFEQSIDPQIYLLLGHYQLLLYSYDNALSAYSKYEQICPEECLLDTSFLYGLGICYFHFNAFKKSAELFHRILYLEPSFIRAKELFIRLGYIYKLRKNIEISTKCFKQALHDKSLATFSNIEIQFHIAHLFEYCGKVTQAKQTYEKLLKADRNTLPLHIRHLCLRQIAWIHHTNTLKQHPQQVVAETDLDVRLLLQALELDNTDGRTWYLLGRCQASLNRVQDAFSAYRSSIDKTEASADTWCSIGVLYQEQNQPMDALQAYFCAVQLDKCHVTAWANLGTLYESMQQYKEALKCYTNAVNADKKNEVRDEIKNRLSTLQNLLSRMPEKLLNGPESQPEGQNVQTLPSVEEAWSLPIPAQLTQRQLQLILQEVSGSPGKSVLAPGVQANKMKRAIAAAIKVNEAIDLKPSMIILDQQDLNSITDQDCKKTSRSLEEYLAGSKRPRGSISSQQQTLVDQKEVGPLTTQERQTLSALHLRGTGLTAQQRQVLQQLQTQALRYHVQNLKRAKLRGCATYASEKQQQQQQLVVPETTEPCKPSSAIKSEPSTVATVTQENISSADNLLTTVADCFGTGGTPGGVPADVGSPTDNLPEDFDLWADEVLAQMTDQLVEMFPPNFEKEPLCPTAKRQAYSADGTPVAVPVDEKPQQQVATAQLSTAPPPPPSPQQMVTDLHAYLTKPLSMPIPNVMSSLNINMLGKQILETLRGVGASGRTWSLSIFADGSPLPTPPNDPFPAAPLDSLHPPSPTVYLENRRDAFSQELMQFCISQPCVVIRGLASILRLDLSLFSTKTLAETQPEQPVEVRLQKPNYPDENLDQFGNQVWYFGSPRTYTTIAKYAAYQASTFVEALKEEKFNNNTNNNSANAGGNNKDDKTRTSLAGKQKMIKFGTNCDLSDESKWFLQLNELNKLPTFLKVTAAPNILSHVGYNLLGVNTVQLYMKVPGSRTPGHQENNNFCSVNVNIGPGDCEWFNVPEQYWGTIHRLCEKHNIDYLSGSWWPVIQDLVDMRVPVYRFIQKPGDLVWINSGTIHWVQAIGWCNNIAWNVGPMCARQYELAITRYEYNRLRGFKSIVPMIHLSWQLAKNVKITDKHLFELIKQTLLRTLAQSQLARDFVEQSLGRKIHYHGKNAEDVAHMCNDCEIEVFNILYVTQQDRKYFVRCLDCIRKVNPSLNNVRVLCEYQQHELIEVYDSFQLQTGPMSAFPVGKS